MQSVAQHDRRLLRNVVRLDSKAGVSRAQLLHGAGREASPEAEIDAVLVAAHQPAQVHVHALAGRLAGRRGHVLTGAAGRIGQAKEGVMEIHQPRPLRVTHQKRGFQGVVLTVPMAQKMHEVQQVGVAKSAVAEAQQLFQILVLVLGYELVRGIVHAAQQLVALVDDGGPLPPGQQRGEEGRDFNILPLAEAVRNLNGVVFDKFRAVVTLILGVELAAEVGDIQDSRACFSLLILRIYSKKPSCRAQRSMTDAYYGM